MSSPEQTLPYVVAPGCVEGDVRQYGAGLGYHLFCVCRQGADGFFSKDAPLEVDERGTYVICPCCKKRKILIKAKEDV